MQKMLRSKKVIIAVVLVAVALAATIGYAVWAPRQIPHSGIVVIDRNFGIYKDYECTTELTAIDWSSLINRTGQSMNVTAFIKNLDGRTAYIN